MDAADLDYRTRTSSGCIPPHLVAHLLEIGHAAEVEKQAGRGEWFCALAWARRLGGQGRQAEALAILEPYAATGWRIAAAAQAELLEGWGRIDEAIAIARAAAATGDRLALGFLARLLTRHGRSDEAFDLLQPRIDDWYLADALVDAAERAGRNEEAADLLVARIEAGPRCSSPTCYCRVEPSNAIGLLATIRERQGRIDEAVAVLHTRGSSTSVNGRDQLADLLARHDRIDELREYAATEYHGHAAKRLAELLEERGDIEGAIGVYRQSDTSLGRTLHDPFRLSELLLRRGRGDEAIATVRALADTTGGAEDWIVGALCTMYAEQGRAGDGLAYLDELKISRGEETWEFFRIRVSLLAADGRRAEALASARAHAEADTWYARSMIAELLADEGRIEEAVTTLAAGDVHRSLLAWYLLDLGRVEEAVAALQRI